MGRQVSVAAAADDIPVAVFTTGRRVRFRHVDPAGVVYYPRYFELIDSALEDWTEATIGIDRRSLIEDSPFGLPTVELDVRFPRPSRLGDRLIFAIQVTEVARASVRLNIVAACEGQPRVVADSTLVLITRATGRACSWPQAWRDRLLDAIKPLESVA